MSRDDDSGSAPAEIDQAVALRDDLAGRLVPLGVDVGARPRVTEGEQLFPTPFPDAVLDDLTCVELLEIAESFFRQGALAAAQVPPDVVGAHYYYMAGSAYLNAWQQNCFIIDPDSG